MGSVNYKKLKKSRRVQCDLGHKSGIKTIEEKCRFTSSPGCNGLRRSAMSGSEFSKQLQMKQLIRFYYLISENQFANYYKKADRMTGSSGLNLMHLLEARLDNVVYRLGFACTRKEARQLVSHGQVRVNGRRVKIGSYQVQVGDVVALTERATAHVRIQAAMALAAQRPDTPWVEAKEFQGTLTRLPEASELPAEFKVSMVVEFYSK
jgi:small subunit ribosomal protein S4